MRKKCSSDREKLLKIKAEGREFSKKFRTIYSNSERSEEFLVTECFLTCFWRFLRSNKLEQLIKFGKKMGFRNIQEKLEKCIYFITQGYLASMFSTISNLDYPKTAGKYEL